MPGPTTGGIVSDLGVGAKPPNSGVFTGGSAPTSTQVAFSDGTGLVGDAGMTYVAATDTLSLGALVLTTALPVTGGGTGSATAATARAALGVAVEQFNWMLEAPTAKTYTIILQSEIAYTINEVIAKTTSGTVTLNFQIDGVSITGLSAIAVTSASATTTASAANALAANSTLTVIATVPSSCVDLVFTVKATR